MTAYASGGPGAQTISFAARDRMIVIVSDRMLTAIGTARHATLARCLKADHRVSGSVAVLFPQ